MWDREKFIQNFIESTSRYLSGHRESTESLYLSLMEKRPRDEKFSDEIEKKFPPDNPLFHPRRHGNEFAERFYRVRDLIREFDPHQIELMRYAAARFEIQSRREPDKWAIDIVLRHGDAGVTGKNVLPRRKSVRKSKVSGHLAQQLFMDWRYRYETDEEALREVHEYLERPLRHGAVKELVALVRPLAKTKGQDQEWVAEYIGIEVETVIKGCKK